MFENVIVGVDGRANGRDAIALGSRLLGPAGKLTLANVHSGALNPLHAATPGRMTEERDASHQLLERERAETEVQAELVSYVASSPGRGLHDLAEESHADLLVVGSCSRGTFGRVLIGDDTRTSLNGAPCAVAVAAHGYAEHPVPIAAIGVGYDRSPESEVAVAAARELAAAKSSLARALEVVMFPNYALTGFSTPALCDSIEALLTESNERMSQMQASRAAQPTGWPVRSRPRSAMSCNCSSSARADTARWSG